MRSLQAYIFIVRYTIRTYDPVVQYHHNNCCTLSYHLQVYLLLQHPYTRMFNQYDNSLDHTIYHTRHTIVLYRYTSMYYLALHHGPHHYAHIYSHPTTYTTTHTYYYHAHTYYIRTTHTPLHIQHQHTTIHQYTEM